MRQCHHPGKVHVTREWVRYVVRDRDQQDATVRQAANLMRGRGIGCLAVVDDDKPIGIGTITDVLELIGRGVERPVEQGKRLTEGRSEDIYAENAFVVVDDEELPKLQNPEYR